MNKNIHNLIDNNLLRKNISVFSLFTLLFIYVSSFSSPHHLFIYLAHYKSVF